MSCANCLNLKTKSMNYGELCQLWNELYAPSEISPGYRNRFVRRSRSIEHAESVKLNFTYCKRGLLSRIYLAKRNQENTPWSSVSNCQEYSSSRDK